MLIFFILLSAFKNLLLSVAQNLFILTCLEILYGHDLFIQVVLRGGHHAASEAQLSAKHRLLSEHPNYPIVCGLYLTSLKWLNQVLMV
jgi:hypothetical protein